MLRGLGGHERTSDEKGDKPMEWIEEVVKAAIRWGAAKSNYLSRMYDGDLADKLSDAEENLRSVLVNKPKSEEGPR